MIGIGILTAVFLLAVGIVTGLLMSTKPVREVSASSQERLRRTVEQAEWQMAQLTRAAFEALSKAARADQRTGWRE